MTTITERFRSLHDSGIFVMPNPWDRGSALTLQDMGFLALATTSAGLGRALGKDDQEVTRDELLRHVSDLTSVLEVPLNVDGERLFPEDPGGISETVRLLANAGAAGCSIEDYSPAVGSIDALQKAVGAVEIAAHACRQHGVVLTARAENHLYGHRTLGRAGVLDAVAAQDALDEALSLPQQLVPLAPDHIRRAFDLRERIHVLDGIYVALAENLECAVVTTDLRLGRAGAPCEVRTPD